MASVPLGGGDRISSQRSPLPSFLSCVFVFWFPACTLGWQECLEQASRCDLGAFESEARKRNSRVAPHALRRPKMRLPRKRAAAGPALGRSPLPRRRPHLGCGEIPGEARAFPAFFRQRPECRNQTRRACRSCLLSESTRYQGLGIASPCLTRTWSRLWARGSACPGQAPSRLRQFPGLRSRGAIVFPLAQNRSFQGS